MGASWDTLLSYYNGMSTTTKVIIGTTSLLLFVGWVTKKKPRLPPGPFALPILGNLLSMRNTAMETLMKMWEKKYGPIFTVYLGPLRTVVISDIDIAHEALVKQGSNFSGRPFLYSIDLMTEGSKDIAFTTYGEVWKYQRKVAVQALRQYLSGNQLEERIQEATQDVIENMEKEKGPFDIHLYLSLDVFNILHGLCFGNTFSFNDPTFRKLLSLFDDLQVNIADGFLEDVIPPLRLWPSKNLTEALKEMSLFCDHLYKQMDERRAHFNEATITCLADNIIQAEKMGGHGNDVQLTNTHTAQIVSDVFGAGVDTTRVTLDWIFLVLVRHPDVQARIHEEINEVVGENIPGREHRSKLVYTSAVIYETMRLYPAVPYGLFHETLVDTNICGYRIPRKTSVAFNIEAMLRSPQHWEDPLSFKPERFLDETQTKIEMRNKSFIPFSLGHRSCPGESLAKIEMLYIIVSLLQKFTFSLAPGEKAELNPLVKAFLNSPPPFKVVIKQR